MGTRHLTREPTGFNGKISISIAACAVCSDTLNISGNNEALFVIAAETIQALRKTGTNHHPSLDYSQLFEYSLENSPPYRIASPTSSQ